MRQRSIHVAVALLLAIAFILPFGTASADTWTQVASKGINGIYNILANDIATAGVEFDDGVTGPLLYVGTEDLANGCQVWRNDGGRDWTCLVGTTGILGPGFGNGNNTSVTSMAVYDYGLGDRLFVGTYNTAGCEVWEYDGSTWSCLVGTTGTMNTGGFGTLGGPPNANNDMASSMAVYDDNSPPGNRELYIGTNDASGAAGCEVWKFNGAATAAVVGSAFIPAGFGNLNGVNSRASSMAVFDDGAGLGPSLWIGTENMLTGCEVWQYNLGIVAGPFSYAACAPLVNSAWAGVPNGFGNLVSANTDASVMAVYNDGAHPGDSLFIGTEDTSGLAGCEVWQYNLGIVTGPFANTAVDSLVGPTPTAVIAPGFGNVNNNLLASMKVCDDGTLSTGGSGWLYMGTENTSAGCEVWAYGGGGAPNWPVPLHVTGFGNPNNLSAASMAVTGVSPAQRICVGTDNTAGAGAGTGCEVLDTSMATGLSRVDPGGGFVDNNYNVSSMAYFDGDIYVGTENLNGPTGTTGCEVWRSCDGTSWTQVVGVDAGTTGGFGNTGNTRATSMAVHNSRLYVGTYNTSGTEIWSTADGTNWVQEPTNIAGTNYCTCSMAVYGNQFYVGTENTNTNQGEIHSYDGTSWSLAAVKTFSFNNDAVTSMAVYDGKLFVGTNKAGPAAPCEVHNFDGATWAQETTGISNANSEAASMCVYGSKLYVGTSNLNGCEVHQFDGSSWSRVASAGLTDVNNTVAESMARYRSRLYLGTWNIPSSGAEVYSYDGSSWTPEATGGFGNPGNESASSMAATNPSLYVGVYNMQDGCEVQRTQTGSGSITSVTPDRAERGDTLNVAITGNGTNFADGISAAAFGSGITVNSTTVTDATHATVNITVGGSASGGNRDIAVTTDWEIVSLDGGFCVEYPAPTIISIAPDTAQNSGIVQVTNLKGTGFRAGATVKLEKDGQGDIPAQNTSVESSSKISCYFDLTDAALGGWDVYVENTDGRSATRPGAFEVTSGASTWYLAEGSTAWGYSCYIAIGNPNSEDLTADITYMTDTGAESGGTVDLPAMSQTTVNPADTLGARDFSAKVVCNEGETIAVDRTMSWPPQGTGAGLAGDKHCSIGVTAPDTTWYLPEGSSAWGFECWHLIQNPNAEDAQVTLTYMIEDEDPEVRTKTVPANSRATYNMADEIGAKDASLKVSSDIPVIPERAMYKNSRQEGHDSIGTTEPSEEYYLAEGTTGWGFTTYVLIQNPNPTPTDVVVIYNTDGGPVNGPAMTMPANSRQTIRVNDNMPDTDFSTSVFGTDPIIAERAMYWGEGTPEGEACHDSIGMPAPHSAFFLPDGEASSEDGGVETWTLVQNPNNGEVEVGIHYLPEGGGAIVRKVEMIPGNSRRTFNMAEHSGITGRASIMVIAGTGAKIMVERAMYWNGRGAGTDTIGGYSD